MKRMVDSTGLKKMSDVCEVCGNPKPDTKSFRPRQYCNDNCREYNKYKNALENALIKMDATDEAKKMIKGDMFRLANIVGNGTK